MIESVAVVVPAHNEQELIGECLESILPALDACGQESYVVVAADSCSDDTARRARDIIGDHGAVIEGQWLNAGAARFDGTRAALNLTPDTHLAGLWLANTDADSVVPFDWIRRQLDYAVQGYAAVAGVIGIADFGGHPPGTSDSFRRSYHLPANGDHSHVHGTNLGVLAGAYITVGGWPKVPLAADHALWRRLRAAGWRTFSPCDVVVRTSGRPFGRAPGGFADTLRNLGLAGG